MTNSLAFILITVFMGLSGIHWYWAFGGRWGFNYALPTNKNGERVLNPRRIDSAIVGLGLLLFAFFYSIKSALFLFNIPNWLLEYGGWLISLIFLLRAIGDFNYLGFFKKVRTTEFAIRDTRYFSPLCLFIVTIAVLLELW